MDIMIYVAIIVAIILRLVLMRGTFVLPTIYRRGNEMSFNLGSITTIIVGLIGAFGLLYTNPEQFVNPLMAFLVSYTSPQLVDGVATSIVRNTIDVSHDEAAE